MFLLGLLNQQPITGNDVMAMIVLFSILALLALGWVLYTNSNDRKTFEKELEEDLADDTEDRP